MVFEQSETDCPFVPQSTMFVNLISTINFTHVQMIINNMSEFKAVSAHTVKPALTATSLEQTPAYKSHCNFFPTRVFSL